jgi:hypothetical protein
MVRDFRDPVVFINPTIRYLNEDVRRETHSEDHNVLDLSRHGEGRYKIKDAG